MGEYAESTRDASRRAGPGRSGDQQVELQRNPSCGPVVEQDSLRLNLNGQGQRLPLAFPERSPQYGLWQRHSQALDE